MKHQFLLFLALLGAVLLWPGCDDDDDIILECEITVPIIAFSDDCTPDPVNLTNLSADCEEGIVMIQECKSSDAIAIADRIEDGADFPDIYVRIKYDSTTSYRRTSASLAV